MFQNGAQNRAAEWRACSKLSRSMAGLLDQHLENKSAGPRTVDCGWFEDSVGNRYT